MREASILTNALYLTLPKFLTVGLNLVVTPLFIQSLGLEVFGVWAVFQSLMFYLLLLDFGIGGALVKFVAEAHTQQAYSRVAALFSTVFYLYLALSGLVLVLATWLREPFCALLNVPEPNTPAMQTLYFTTFGAFAFYALTIAINSVFEGVQAFALSAGVISLGLFLSNAIVAGLLWLGCSVAALAWGHLAAMAIMLCSAAMLLRVRFPYITLSAFDSALLCELFRYGMRLHLSTASLWLITRLEVPLVASLLGTSAAGTFRIAMQLSALAREFPTLGLPALFSAAVSLHTANKREHFQQLAERATQYLTFAVYSLSGFLFFNIESVLRFWLNVAEVSTPARIAQWLLIGFAFNAVASTAVVMLRARSELQVETRLNAVMMVLHLVCNLAALHWLGDAALGLATLSVVSLLSLVMMQQGYRVLQIHFGKVWQRTLLPMAGWTALNALGAAFIASYIVRAGQEPSLRAAALQTLMLSGALFAIGQGLIAVRFKLIETTGLWRIVQRNAPPPEKH